MMQCNVGTGDKAIRIVLAFVLVILGFMYKVWWLYALAAIPFITAVIGFCPLYTLLRISTCKKQEQTAATPATEAVPAQEAAAPVEQAEEQEAAAPAEAVTIAKPAKKAARKPAKKAVKKAAKKSVKKKKR